MSFDYTEINWNHFRKLAELDLNTVSVVTGIKRKDLESAENKYTSDSLSTFRLKDEEKFKLLTLYQDAINMRSDYLRQKSEGLRKALPAFDICREALRKKNSNANS